MFEPLLNQIQALAATAQSTGELHRSELVRYPHLLIAPLWFAIIHNGLLDRDHPLDIGDLFEANLEFAFDDRESWLA